MSQVIMSASIISSLNSMIDQFNWQFTYGPYELWKWEEALSIYDQLTNRSDYYYEDREDFMEYSSMEVI